MISRILASICARILSKRSHQTARERILAQTRLMRKQLGKSEDRRLA